MRLGTKFNFEEFVVKVNSEKTLHISAYIKKIREGYSEVVECEGLKGEYPYGNRPWESCRYEVALKQLAERFGGECETAIKNWLEYKIKAERGEAERFIKEFDIAWGQLTDEQKQLFQGKMIENREQADLLLNTVKACALFNEIRKKV